MKPFIAGVLSEADTFGWNQKFLDYEIETYGPVQYFAFIKSRWNQKFLDYEIETRGSNNALVRDNKLESKVSRLRD